MTTVSVILREGADEIRVAAAIESVHAQDVAARVEIVPAPTFVEGCRRAGGDVIAFLDAGHPWLPGKLDRQLALLEQRPEVGLVYGDEAMVNDDGLTFAASAFRQLGVAPLRGRVLDELLVRDFVPEATVVLRRSLVPALPAGAPARELEGWWISAAVAAVAEIDYVPVAVTRRGSAQTVIEAGERLALRRALLRGLPLDTLGVEELEVVWRTFLTDLAATAERRGLALPDLVGVTGADRAEALERAAGAAEGRDRGEHAHVLRDLLAARAANPFDAAVRGLWDTTLDDARLAAAVASVPPSGATEEERVDWAEARYGEGDVDSAVAELVAVAAVAEDGAVAARAHGDLAVIAFEHGRLGDARRASRAALRHDPAHVAALETLGSCSSASGDHFQAAHWLGRAVAVAPGDPALWRALGAAQYDGGRFEAAIDALVEAGRLAPLPAGDADRLELAGRWAAGAAVRVDAPTERDHRRLLLVVDFFYPSVGGLEHIAEGVGIALHDLGWTVEIACRALRERTELERFGMRIHELEGDGDGIESGRAAGLKRVAAEGRFDAVLCFSDPAAWPIPAVLGLPSGPRVVVVPCITAHSGAAVRRTEVLAGYRASLERAEVIVHNSERGFDAWLNRDLGVDAVYVPQAIAEREPEGSIREELGLDPDKPMLMYVANMHPHKNHAGLLEALVDHPGDWQLVLSGFPSPGVPQEAVRVFALAKRDPRVTVIPGGLPPAKVAAAMREADLFVCPSHSDAVPLVIQESMCHGLPWIATPGCGAVHDWAGGLILPVEDFGTAIDHLLADRSALAALGAAGRAHWEACFHYGVAPRCYDALLRGASAVPDFPAPADALATTDRIRADVYDALVRPLAPAIA